MRMLSSADIAGTLKWEPLIERLEKAFLEGFQCPPRHHHSIDRASGEATLLLMPAWQNEGYIGVKVVNVFPIMPSTACPQYPVSTCSAKGSMALQLPAWMAAN